MESKKRICSACGTSPINHTLAFTLSFLDETLGELDKVLQKIAERDFWQRTADFVEKILFSLGSLIGIVRFNKDDIEKAPVGRSKIIWEEARRRGIPMEQVVIFGRPIDYYRAKINAKENGRNFYFNSLPIPPHLLQKGYKWVDDKLHLSEVLEEANIPSPKTRKIKTLAQARKAFDNLNKPVILKPEWGSRGRHTTTNINTLEELEKAFNLAKQITTSMVLQEHLEGSIYRATVIENKLVGFFRADQPQVVGDGVKTIRELIEEKNKNRTERVSEILINEDLENFLARQGYNLSSILQNNKIVNLSAKTGRMYGSYTKEMLPEVHPKMHNIFEQAGALCQAPVLGFDLIIEDPTKDPETQKWGIIECNSLPFIDLHYFALEGPRINLAKNIWDLWEK